MDGLNEELNVFGQQPGLSKLYTQLTSCYSIDDPSKQPTIVDTLKTGLETLARSFPWIAGKVVNEPRESDSKSVFKIVPFENAPRLIVKDLRDDPSAPHMADLKSSRFPFRMFDENVIAPCKTLSFASPILGTDSAPVFLAQANFVQGGLLLTCVTQHNVMDMTGQSEIMRLWSKACRNEPFTDEEVANGNLIRADIVPLLDDNYVPGPELDYQLVKIPAHKQDQTSEAPVAPPKCAWEYFIIEPKQLDELKVHANSTLTSSSYTPSCTFVSADDAVTALIYKSVAQARSSRLPPDSTSTVARAIDPRSYIGLPTTYPGIVQNMTYQTLPISQLVSEPLGAIAARLRADLDPVTSERPLGHATRSLATYMSRTDDMSTVSVMAKFDPSSDVTLSSWARVRCYELDFGLGLGVPEAVRRPRFEPFESLMYLMPRSAQGEMVIGMSLREDDLRSLKANEDWTKYAHSIG